MVSVVRSVRRRVDPAPFTAAVAAGDLVCIAVFVFGGAVGGHGFDPVAQFGHVAMTYASFVIGWAVVAVPGGLYAAGARRTARRAVALTALAWVLAAVLAQGLRATAPFPGRTALTFYLVSVAVGGALLTGWRLAVAKLT